MNDGLAHHNGDNTFVIDTEEKNKGNIMDMRKGLIKIDINYVLDSECGAMCIEPASLFVVHCFGGTVTMYGIFL